VQAGGQGVVLGVGHGALLAVVCDMRKRSTLVGC
jgi:hypothetical protein